jgi:hypothetical protein
MSEIQHQALLPYIVAPTLTPVILSVIYHSVSSSRDYIDLKMCMIVAISEMMKRLISDGITLYWRGNDNNIQEWIEHKEYDVFKGVIETFVLTGVTTFYDGRIERKELITSAALILGNPLFDYLLSLTFNIGKNKNKHDEL